MSREAVSRDSANNDLSGLIGEHDVEHRGSVRVLLSVRLAQIRQVDANLVLEVGLATVSVGVMSQGQGDPHGLNVGRHILGLLHKVSMAGHELMFGAAAAVAHVDHEVVTVYDRSIDIEGVNRRVKIIACVQSENVRVIAEGLQVCRALPLGITDGLNRWRQTIRIVGIAGGA